MKFRDLIEFDDEARKVFIALDLLQKSTLPFESPPCIRGCDKVFKKTTRFPKHFIDDHRDDYLNLLK